MSSMMRDASAVSRLRWACRDFGEGVRKGATGEELDDLSFELERARRRCLRLGVPAATIDVTVETVAAELRREVA